MSETFFSANDLIVNNGFVRNPNRYYSEEYFEKIPSMNTSFILPTTTGDTDFNIVQPAGSFLKNVYVVCLSVPTSGNVGLSLSHTNVAATGNLIPGTATNIVNGTAILNSVNSLAVSGVMYTSSSRVLYCRLSTVANAPVSGSFALITEFCDINTGSSPLNQNYYLSVTGTGTYTTANGLFPSDYSIDSGGIILKTAGAVNDEVIVINKNFERSTVGLWKTDSEIEWECKIKTPDSVGIANLCIWAGLKITNTHLYTNASDTDQAYFLYSTDTTGGGVDTDGKLYFIYSTSNGVAKDNYITNLGLKLFDNKLYNLKIRIDGDRKISIYVDNSQVGISKNTAEVLAINSIDKSLALATNKDLKPYIGIKNVGTGGSKYLIVCYQKLSKIIK
jgi:hypothetical protein